MACGFTGEPTEPVTVRGGATNINSYTPSSAQSAASASRSNISPMWMPALTSKMICNGWKMSGVSLGRTSMPQVSRAMAATCRSHRNGAALIASPGAGPPPAYRHPSSLCPARPRSCRADQNDIPLTDDHPLLSRARLQIVAMNRLAHVQHRFCLYRATSSNTPRVTILSLTAVMLFFRAPVLLSPRRCRVRCTSGPRGRCGRGHPIASNTAIPGKRRHRCSGAWPSVLALPTPRLRRLEA